MIELGPYLYNLLVVGAGLAASAGAGEFGKTAVKEAFDAIKSRLTGPLGAKSFEMIEDAETDPDCGALIRKQLARSAVAEDTEIRGLARTLDAAIEALPEAARAHYAVRIREIRAGRHLVFDNVVGVQADTATSEGDMTFSNVTSPGKP